MLATCRLRWQQEASGVKLRAENARTLLLAAALVVGAWGIRDEIPWMVIAGVFALGAYLAWDGALNLSRSPWRPTESSPPLPAAFRLWQTASAGLEAAAGAALLALALTASISGWERMTAYLGRHPGWLAIVAGLAMARGGLGVMVAPQPAATQLTYQLRNLLERLTGLPSLAVGTVLILVGGFQVLFPGAITSWVQAALMG